MDPLSNKQDSAVHTDVAVDLACDVSVTSTDEHSIELSRLLQGSSLEDGDITVGLDAESNVSAAVNGDAPVHLTADAEVICHVDAVVDPSAVRRHGRSVRAGLLVSTRAEACGRARLMFAAIECGPRCASWISGASQSPAMKEGPSTGGGTLGGSPRRKRVRVRFKAPAEPILAVAPVRRVAVVMMQQSVARVMAT